MYWVSISIWSEASTMHFFLYFTCCNRLIQSYRKLIIYRNLWYIRLILRLNYVCSRSTFPTWPKWLTSHTCYTIYYFFSWNQPSWTGKFRGDCKQWQGSDCGSRSRSSHVRYFVHAAANHSSYGRFAVQWKRCSRYEDFAYQSWMFVWSWLFTIWESILIDFRLYIKIIYQSDWTRELVDRSINWSNFIAVISYCQ